MEDRDQIYRTLREIETAIQRSPEGRQRVDALLAEKSDGERWRCETIRCIPAQDWIDTLEQALPYLEKAVEEQRRFIRSHREIVRIDQAKQVSPESVKHLAQHSDYITHLAPDGGVLPDKLLVVERQENYAIYENRFLHTLIQNATRFVESRYLEMAAAEETDFQLNMQHTTQRGRNDHTFALLLQTKERPDGLPKSVYRGAEAGRLEEIRRRIHALSASPLMHMLEGSPPITPPVVHTNVFKRNSNFQQALALFEFLDRYQGAGYELEKTQSDGAPDDALRKDYAALLTLAQYAAEQRADPRLLPLLERHYREENERREQECLLAERAREQEVLSRIDAAVQAERCTHERKLAKKQSEITQLLDERHQWREQAQKRIRRTAERLRALLNAQQKERELNRCETERLQGELALEKRRVREAEDENQRITQETQQALQRQAETAVRKQAERDAEWQSLLETQSVEGQRALESQRCALEQQLSAADTTWQARLETQKTQDEAALEAQRVEWERQLRILAEEVSALRTRCEVQTAQYERRLAEERRKRDELRKENARRQKEMEKEQLQKVEHERQQAGDVQERLRQKATADLLAEKTKNERELRALRQNNRKELDKVRRRAEQRNQKLRDKLSHCIEE